MKEKIWFVTDGVSPIGCFLSRTAASDYLNLYSEDEDFNYYDMYDIFTDDLEDYPDEYDLALEEGLI